MKPVHIGYGNFDESKYVYGYCKCPLPTDWVITFNKILDGKPHFYSCICEDCGTKVSIFTDFVDELPEYIADKED